MLWFVNRGTGVILVVLLTLSMMLGILATSRNSPRLWPRMLSQGLHRNISMLAVTFLAAHVVTAVVDSYVDIRWWHVFVPFTGSYRQPWLGIAALSMDLSIAVAVTSILRHRMSHRPWRAVHILAYVAWGLGLVHGMRGTDAGTAWGAGVNYGSITVVSVAVLVRIGTHSRSNVVKRDGSSRQMMPTLSSGHDACETTVPLGARWRSQPPRSAAALLIEVAP